MFTGLLVLTGILAFLSLFLTLPPAAHSQQARFTNVNTVVHPQPLVFSIPLLEAGNIRAGPLKVHPHFGIAQTYTDNVFRTARPLGVGSRTGIRPMRPASRSASLSWDVTSWHSTTGRISSATGDEKQTQSVNLEDHVYPDDVIVVPESFF